MRLELWCPPVAKKAVVWTDRGLLDQLKTFNARMDRVLTAATAYHATRAVGYARTHAPWTDRTSNARNGLFAKAERDRPYYRIIIAHGVPYGIWLEVRFAGRYQIIRPTVDHEGPELMKTASMAYAKIFKTGR